MEAPIAHKCIGVVVVEEESLIDYSPVFFVNSLGSDCGLNHNAASS
jgi:hypothetical protein